MIRPLRVRHRRTMTVLAVVLPVLFAAGLLARRPIPTMDAPDVAAGAELPPGFLVAARTETPGEPAIRVTWLREDGASSRLAVTLEPLRDPAQPDLLVYWSAGEGAPPDRLPDDAHLLGNLADRHRRSWVLPGRAAGEDVRLIFYSLAHHRVLAVAAPPPDTRVHAGAEQDAPP